MVARLIYVINISSRDPDCSKLLRRGSATPDKFKSIVGDGWGDFDLAMEVHCSLANNY